MDGYQTGVYGYKIVVYGVPAKIKGVFEDRALFISLLFHLFSALIYITLFSFSQRRMIFTMGSLDLTLSFFNFILHPLHHSPVRKTEREKKKRPPTLCRCMHACFQIISSPITIHDSFPYPLPSGLESN